VRVGRRPQTTTGIADLFVADGDDWIWADAGRNWHPFAPYVVRTRDLRFGDFNMDGKTDVFGAVAGQWQIVPAQAPPGRICPALRPRLKSRGWSSRIPTVTAWPTSPLNV
jgi:hypothetical protein